LVFPTAQAHRALSSAIHRQVFKQGAPGTDGDIFLTLLLRALIPQRLFPLLGAGQCFLLDRDRIAPCILYLLGLGGVELGVFDELCREIAFRVDGVHRANLDACRAIDALIRMNDELAIQLVEASDRAHLFAVGKLASIALLCDDVSHRVRVVMGW
jgi:hypothetical protein